MDVRTTKPISTISYNTPSFLKVKLDELTASKRISFWAFVPHLAEDDEGGKKDHCHVYIELSKMTQTDELKEALKEFDPALPDKPKGCISFRSSKFGDWYLYGLHDKRYLASKGQSRCYHYSHSDFITSDDDDLLYMVRSIDLRALSPYADMIEAQSLGISWSEYFSRGTVPLPQLVLFEKAWFMLLNGKTDRNGRNGHDIDAETGEVYE